MSTMLRSVLEQESGGFSIIREWVSRESAEARERPSEPGLEGREDLEDA